MARMSEDPRTHLPCAAPPSPQFAASFGKRAARAKSHRYGPRARMSRRAAHGNRAAGRTLKTSRAPGTRRPQGHCMRRLHANGHSQVDALLRGLSNLGWALDPGARILDFGCGAGGTVYEWRERGYDACGFDLIDTVALRQPGDRRFFSSLEKPRENPADTRIADKAVRTPYGDASFDFIYSLAVIEHCYALDGMMAECARLLKPDGIALHLFPSRNQLIEPHFYVPFGGRIQSDAWLRLWARLGVRNEGQRGMTPEETAAHNRFYCDTGLAYRSGRAVRRIAARHFGEAWLAGGDYHRDDSLLRRTRRYLAALRSGQPLAALGEAPEQRVLATALPRRAAAAPVRMPARRLSAAC